MERSKPQEKQEVMATVVEALPNDLFRVELGDKSSLLAHVSARRQNDFLRLLPGDCVRVRVSPYDQRRGRITGRYQS
jgi:translation initiation factor IF-1